MDRAKLIDLVVEQIKQDLEANDETAICELLESVSEESLLAFLPESLFDPEFEGYWEDEENRG